MAAYGLVIRNPNTGEVILNVTDRLTRIVGTFTAGPAAGSITVPSDIEGDIFFFPVGFLSYTFGNGSQGTFTVSGRTISWGVLPSALAMYYGVY